MNEEQELELLEEYGYVNETAEALEDVKREELVNDLLEISDEVDISTRGRPNRWKNAV